SYPWIRLRPPPAPYTTLFRSDAAPGLGLAREPAGAHPAIAIGHAAVGDHGRVQHAVAVEPVIPAARRQPQVRAVAQVHAAKIPRSEEHTSELQSREKLVCRLL